MLLLRSLPRCLIVTVIVMPLCFMQVWLETFDLAARKPDIDAIIAENAFMAELQARIVPLIVQYNDFWTRYFYQ